MRFEKMFEMRHSCSPFACEIDEESQNDRLNCETPQTTNEQITFERLDSAQSGETCSVHDDDQWKRADRWTTKLVADSAFLQSHHLQSDSVQYR